MTMTTNKVKKDDGITEQVVFTNINVATIYMTTWIKRQTYAPINIHTLVL